MELKYLTSFSLLNEEEVDVIKDDIVALFSKCPALGSEFHSEVFQFL